MGMQLVDANKIEPDLLKSPVEVGDLVRAKINGKEQLATAGEWHNGCRPRYYLTQNGSIHPRSDVNVIEIIGKCVFSVYR